MTAALLSPASAGAATITVNTDTDPAPADEGLCTLREAIAAAATDNESGMTAGECITGSGPDTIDFNIAPGGGGAHMIQPVSALPTVTDSTTIDGSATDPDPIEIDGSGAGMGVDGLSLGSGTNTIRGLSVYGFSQDGIRTVSASGADTIEDSFIGTDSTGTAGIGNGRHGVGNVILDGLMIEDNVISGNGAVVTGHGVDFAGTNIDASVIKGNRIGTNPAGTLALPNDGDGIQLSSPGDMHVIGGSGPGEGNVISGNTGYGIRLQGSTNDPFETTDNTISGNLIGTDAAGTTAIPNSIAGLIIFNDVRASTIEENVISGNADQGVHLTGALDPPTGNTIAANAIGVGMDGTTPVANGKDGIRLEGGATSNVIGGAAPGAGNLIAHNGTDGVALLNDGTVDNSILGNSIHSNGNTIVDLGIDLAGNGVSLNDGAGDGDLGPNGLQNFPVITGAQTNSVDTTIQGTLDSVASRTFRIEFFSNAACDDSGNGEGRTFLGAENVFTNVSGNAQIAATVSPSTPGEEMTATATDQTPDEANTSEFSQCVTIASKPEPPPPPPPPPPAQIATVLPSNLFELGKLKRNKKKGIAFLFVNVPGPGEVGLAGKGIKNVGIASASARKSVFTAGGVVKLKIKPGKGKKARKLVQRLKDKGKAKLKVLVTYAPTGGLANTQARKVKLVRK
ncbi:MAG: hypothetical protein ACRDL6_01305 [Solirubrobacterales bacterium]